MGGNVAIDKIFILDILSFFVLDAAAQWFLYSENSIKHIVYIDIPNIIMTL